MAIVEMEVFAPARLDNPREIKRINELLRRKFKLVVCFYTPVPWLMPIRQNNGSWSLRFVELDERRKLKMNLLSSLKEELTNLGFIMKM